LVVFENIFSIAELFHDKKKAKELTKNLIQQFSLQGFQLTKGKLLSGGERRRTEIARALASNPKFLLLDEPFAGVDPIAVEDIQSIVATLKQKNIGLDVLYKYAEYLECKVEDFLAVKVTRQINGYVHDNKINFYKNDEERPVLSGFFTAAWWWNDKKTVIIIDKNDPKGVYYNFLNF